MESKFKDYINEFKTRKIRYTHELGGRWAIFQRMPDDSWYLVFYLSTKQQAFMWLNNG